MSNPLVDNLRNAIDSVADTNKYSKQVKQNLIQFYCVDNAHRLQNKEITPYFMQTLTEFVHVRSVRMNAKTELLKACVNLETHKYAPELNTLHFENGATFKCGSSTEQNYKYTIENSIEIMLNLMNHKHLVAYTFYNSKN